VATEESRIELRSPEANHHPSLWMQVFSLHNAPLVPLRTAVPAKEKAVKKPLIEVLPKMGMD